MSKACYIAQRDPLVQAQDLLAKTRLTLADLIAAQRQLTEHLDALRLEMLADITDLSTGVAAAQRREAQALRHP